MFVAFKIGKVLEAEAVVFMGFRIVGAKMKRILQRRAAAVVGVGVFVILSLPTVAAAQQTIVEYTIPTASSAPAGMTPGPDGALWFIENGGNNVGRMTPDGGVTNEYAIPTASSAPNAIVAGPDGIGDRGQRIAELMGQHGQELVLPPHLLGDLVLRFPPLGHVAEDQYNTLHGTARATDGSAAIVDRAVGAVARDEQSMIGQADDHSIGQHAPPGSRPDGACPR